MGDTRGCLRKEECKYLHISSKKGIHVKRNTNYHETKHESQNKTDSTEIIIEKKDDEIVHVLKEASDTKDVEIKMMSENVSKLFAENEILIEENNKIKRILKNMDLEIKRLRSQTD